MLRNPDRLDEIAYYRIAAENGAYERGGYPGAAYQAGLTFLQPYWFPHREALMRVPGLDPGIDPRIHVFGATTKT